MIAMDEEAFICDMAETYRIYNYKSVPCRLLGTLAAGLRDSSRIKQEAAGITTDPQTVLLASVLDIVKLLWWSKTEAGQKNEDRPESIAEHFLIREEQTEKVNLSPEEYREIRNSILKGAE